MINYIYFACFIISVMNLVGLSFVARGKKSFHYVVSFMLITISNFGYLTIANAENIQVALVANTLVYFGATFFPYSFLMSLSNFCKIRIPRLISLSLFTLNCFVFCLVWTTVVGSRLYFEEVSLGRYWDITVLEYVPGRWHWVHGFLLTSYMLAAIGVLLYTYFKNKNVSYKNVLAFIGLEVFTMTVVLLDRVWKDPVNSMNMAYVIDEFVLLFLIHRLGEYDVSDCVASTLEKHEGYAYMMFDRKLNYLGCNETLKTFFPTVHHVRVDKKIDPKGDPQIVKAVAWLRHSVKSKEKTPLYVSSEGRTLKCTWTTLYNGFFGGLSGYLVEVMDDTKQQKYMELLTNYNAKLENEVTEKLEHIKTMQDQIILGLSDIVESRDDSTGGHVKRTSEGVRILVEQLEKESHEFHLAKQFCENVIKAAPMHDLGKIAVDDAILRKPGKFTTDEYEIMKIHAGRGADIVGKALNGLEDEKFLKVAKNIARYHHEKWNGQGYPEGLTGEKIPLEARIMALADVFDALVSRRCYKEKYSFDEAFAIIENDLGEHFDPKLGRAFLACRDRLEEFYRSLPDV